MDSRSGHGYDKFSFHATVVESRMVREASDVGAVLIGAYAEVDACWSV
jgi:hypothetical protein